MMAPQVPWPDNDFDVDFQMRSPSTVSLTPRHGSLHRDNTKRRNNLSLPSDVVPIQKENRTHSNTIRKKELYELPPSITFLSLVLPNSASREEVAKVKSGVLLNEAIQEDSTVATFATGDSAYAKDRVKETIRSNFNLDYYLGSTKNLHLKVKNEVKSVPINVDFALESNQSEVASFVKPLLQSRQYNEVIDVYESMLQSYRDRHGLEHPSIVATLHNLTVVHMLSGKFEMALPYCQQALDLRRRIAGSNNISVATSLSDMGIIYYARENFSKALKSFNEALQITCNAVGYNHPQVASILNNIGCIRFAMGNVINSLSTFEEALNLQRSFMGSISSEDADRALLNMATTLCNAGIVLSKRMEIEPAISLLEEALIVQQSVLPDDHSIVLGTCYTLSSLQDDDDLSNDAIFSDFSNEVSFDDDIPRDAVEGMKTQPKTLDFLKLGSLRKDIDSCQRVMRCVTEESLHHALTLANFHGVSNEFDFNSDLFIDVNSDFNQFCEEYLEHIQKCEADKARKLLKKVTVSIRERYGENHPLIGSIFFSVGSIHLYQKDLHHALNAFQQAETIHSTSLGSDNPMVIMSLTKIAMIKLALNEIEQALICFQQVVRIYRKTLGYSHPKVAIILNNIGVCHYHEVGGLIASLKSFEEALETQRESMLQCKNSKKKNELYAAMAGTLENIAFIHYKKKEYTESIMALEEALSLRQKVYGGDDRLCETNENLAYVMAVANSKGNICDLEHMTNMYIEMLGN